MWVKHGVSTLDLFRKKMALLTPASAWEDAAKASGADLDVHRIERSDFPDYHGISPTGAVLVRPDGYVAWRAADDASASPEEVTRVLASVLSLTPRSPGQPQPHDAASAPAPPG
jgi:hypothetical protein